MLYGYPKFYCWSYVTYNTDLKNTDKSSSNTMSTHTAMRELPETSISTQLGEYNLKLLTLLFFKFNIICSGIHTMDIFHKHFCIILGFNISKNEYCILTTSIFKCVVLDDKVLGKYFLNVYCIRKQSFTKLTIILYSSYKWK